LQLVEGVLGIGPVAVELPDRLQRVVQVGDQRTCMRPPSVSTTRGCEGSSPPPRRAASALRLASPIG
ncbi:MAG: hypothetical protein O9343_18440, partial [Burkholderiaceae bacterium]|nr:hypothetical protein [Burkholderiaceae bacterium]